MDETTGGFRALCTKTVFDIFNMENRVGVVISSIRVRRSTRCKHLTFCTFMMKTQSASLKCLDNVTPTERFCFQKIGYSVRLINFSPENARNTNCNTSCCTLFSANWRKKGLEGAEETSVERFTALPICAIPFSFLIFCASGHFKRGCAGLGDAFKLRHLGHVADDCGLGQVVTPTSSQEVHFAEKPAYL